MKPQRENKEVSKHHSPPFQMFSEEEFITTLSLTLSFPFHFDNYVPSSLCFAMFLCGKRQANPSDCEDKSRDSKFLEESEKWTFIRQRKHTKNNRKGDESGSQLIEEERFSFLFKKWKHCRIIRSLSCSFSIWIPLQPHNTPSFFFHSSSQYSHSQTSKNHPNPRRKRGRRQNKV